jgi:hypothetical protein
MSKFGKKNLEGGHNSNSFRMSEKALDGEFFLTFIKYLFLASYSQASGVRESVCSASSSEPSLALREAIKSGASNLKERLFIQLESDKSNNTQYLRRGDVQVGSWVCLFRSLYFLIHSLMAGT